MTSGIATFGEARYWFGLLTPTDAGLGSRRSPKPTRKPANGDEKQRHQPGGAGRLDARLNVTGVTCARMPAWHPQQPRPPMAIYHFSAKVIQRSQGRSVIAAAAYRAAEALHDDMLGRTFNYLDKPGVVHSEILLPAGAPSRWLDRAMLWNEAQQVERRKDAVLAREIELALPRELSQAEAIALARDFVREQFVARGMVADLNVHWGQAADGEAQPHAHVMLAMRRVIRTGGATGGRCVRAEGARLERQGAAADLARRAGRRWPTSGSPKPASTCGSITARTRRAASTSNHRTRSARPARGARCVARMPSAPTSTARLPGATASGCWPSPSWRCRR